MVANLRKTPCIFRNIDVISNLNVLSVYNTIYFYAIMMNHVMSIYLCTHALLGPELKNCWRERSGFKIPIKEHLVEPLRQHMMCVFKLYLSQQKESIVMSVVISAFCIFIPFK